MLLEDAQFKDFSKNTGHEQSGINGHIMFGHGPTQDIFEKRDWATTNQVMYEERQKVETLINPNTFKGDSGIPRQTQHVNVKPAEVPSMFKTAQVASLKPKSYNEFTKRYDNNSLNMNLRGQK